MKLIRSVAALAVAGLIGALGVGAAATPAVGATPIHTSASGAIKSSQLSERITVTLSPISPSALSATPKAGPQIICSIYLRQYVHYSKVGKDTSWHWSWSCDGAVTLTGGQSLYDQGYRVKSGSVSNRGTTGGENIRYYACIGAYWWGTAYGTFVSPGYSPASFEGSSPTNLIHCP